MAQYGKSEYWDSRYANDTEAFEWYQHWVGFKDRVAQFLQPSSQILVAGCGMSEDLYEDGYQNQLNIDFSSVVIKAMQEKHKDKPGMQFKKMDLRDLEFPDGVFNAVLDKATMDSILCAEGAMPLAAKCLSEISRVLAPGGVFVCISHGHPNARMSILDRAEYGWTVSVQNVPKPMLKLMKDHLLSEGNGEGEERVYHYVYICVKK